MTEEKTEPTFIKYKLIQGRFPPDIYESLVLEKLRIGVPLRELVPQLVKEALRMRANNQTIYKKEEEYE